MTFHQNILAYQKYYYLKISLVMVTISLVLFFTHGDISLANGGTWQGYVLGTMSAILIIWLALLGIRKRRYSSVFGSVQGWTSAHIYLGLALVVITTLHSAFQVGINVHTLAYVLLLIVVVSGIIGMYFYISLPKSISSNLINKSRNSFFKEIAELNEQAIECSSKCSVDIQGAVGSAIERTSIGGGLMTQLLGFDNSKMLLESNRQTYNLVGNKDQKTIISFVADSVPKARKKDEAANLQDLLSLLCRRQYLLGKIRQDIQYKALLDVWLYVHIPTTAVLIVALLIHIFSVFFYW